MLLKEALLLTIDTIQYSKDSIGSSMQMRCHGYVRLKKGDTIGLYIAVEMAGKYLIDKCIMRFKPLTPAPLGLIKEL